MTIQEVADSFFQLSQEGKWSEIQNELFAQDAQSIEPPTSQGLKSAQGLDAIKKKGEAWNNMVQEVHGGYSGKPQIAGNHFSVPMGVDVTLKGAGRSKMDEIAVYEVKDGKIVKEQFFF